MVMIGPCWSLCRGLSLFFLVECFFECWIVRMQVFTTLRLLVLARCGRGGRHRSASMVIEAACSKLSRPVCPLRFHWCPGTRIFAGRFVGSCRNATPEECQLESTGINWHIIAYDTRVLPLCSHQVAEFWDVRQIFAVNLTGWWYSSRWFHCTKRAWVFCDSFWAFMATVASRLLGRVLLVQVQLFAKASRGVRAIWANWIASPMVDAGCQGSSGPAAENMHHRVWSVGRGPFFDTKPAEHPTKGA